MSYVHPALQGLPWLDSVPGGPEPIGEARLAALTAALASHPRLWRPLVRHDPERRWYELLLLTGAIELWLIGWAPGQGTPVHDHGGAAGALTVAVGELAEEVHDRSSLAVTGRCAHGAGDSVGFDAGHVHRVVNLGAADATSIPAYSPPNRPLRRYDRAGMNAGQVAPQ